MKKVLASWGPGRFDALLDKDGKALRPDGKQAGTLIPPAFGLAGVNLHTWTGFGSVPYWNAYVASTEMHGRARSSTRGWATRRSTRCRPRPARTTSRCAGRPTRRRRSCRRCTTTSCRSRRPKAPGGLVRQGRRRPGQGAVLRQGRLRALPRAAAVHRARAQRARARRDRRRQLPGRPLADQDVPDGAARRPVGHQKGGFYHDGRFATLDGRRQPLRRPLQAGAHQGRKSTTSSNT